MIIEMLIIGFKSASYNVQNTIIPNAVESSTFLEELSAEAYVGLHYILDSV
jgi:hypothetical protein